MGGQRRELLEGRGQGVPGEGGGLRPRGRHEHGHPGRASRPLRRLGAGRSARKYSRSVCRWARGRRSSCRRVKGGIVCEAVARRGKSLGQQLKELFVKVGSFYPQRDNFRLTEEVKAKFTEKLRLEPRDFYGRKVSEVVRKDGLKLVFTDGSWLCYRLSGTEPVVRLYSEASSPPELEKLVAAGKQWIFES